MEFINSMDLFLSLSGIFDGIQRDYIYIFGVYIYNYIRNIKVIHGKNEGATINQWEFHGIYIRDIYI
jgi:hypothetical protein